MIKLMERHCGTENVPCLFGAHVRLSSTLYPSLPYTQVYHIPNSQNTEMKCTLLHSIDYVLCCVLLCCYESTAIEKKHKSETCLMHGCMQTFMQFACMKGHPRVPETSHMVTVPSSPADANIPMDNPFVSVH